MSDPDDGDAPRPRPRRGASGLLAAGMLGLREALEGPKKETIVVQVDAAGDPPNIDEDGLDESLGEHRVSGPPLDDLTARANAARAARRSRRR